VSWLGVFFFFFFFFVGLVLGGFLMMAGHEALNECDLRTHQGEVLGGRERTRGMR
jgi:hypothetical protein